MRQVLDLLGPAADLVAVVGFISGVLTAGIKVIVSYRRRQPPGPKEPPGQPLPRPPSPTGAARSLFFGLCALVLAFVAVFARAVGSSPIVYVLLQWIVLPLATAAGFYGFSGFYRAWQNRRADPMLYASAGLMAGIMGAVTNVIVSNDL